jgi:hypothetical protein
MCGLMAGASGLGQEPPPSASPAPSGGGAGTEKPAAKPDFPPHTEVLKDYEQVVSSIDKAPSLMQIWVRRRDGQMMAVFPEKFAEKKFFIALTVASGERYAGLQAGDMYVYWRRQDKRMVMLTPNLEVRSTGEAESKASVKRLFTDRVIVDVPIQGVMPGWGPIIDMDALLVGEAGRFFGSMVRGARTNLVTIKNAKAFPGNVELAFELPMADGLLKTLHYSISEIVSNPAYKPRMADERVGYFTTTFADLGKYQARENRVRYINRWHLEKADPSIQISPPKHPIVFYLESTTPIRYRRWVREGALMWNKAFERIGIANAIEVYYQDAATGAHMEKDPEDVRYNFIRWLNNDVGTAIGPSRVDPLSGQILDADIILTDGWIRHYWRQFHEMIPTFAMEGVSPATLAWLQGRPQWDPRVRLSPPANRPALMAEMARMGPQAYGGHPMASVDPTLVGSNDFDGLIGRTSQFNGLCRAAECKALDLSVMRFAFELLQHDVGSALASSEGEGEGGGSQDPKKPEPKKEEPKEALLDGIPEWFVGPLIAELVAHEVGHTLGLRHNFRASSIYTLEQLNSLEFKGKKPFAGSVMDYLPVNIFDWEDKEKQGDYAQIDIGPYDVWAIEYGYALSDKADDLKAILARASEPELTYATDEDTIGPDPLARRYDFAADPLSYARRQMELARFQRARLLGKFVKEGESWSRARYGYEMTLALQTRAVSMMSAWLGGAFIHRDKKGDPGDRAPIQVVPVGDQRDALAFVLETTFRDDAYGLDPVLLVRMSVDKWLDQYRVAFEESTWPVHDRIMGIQSTVLTRLLNPGTLGRVYDNEFLTPAEEDMVTLPEIFRAVEGEIWSELDQSSGTYTERKPMISSLRRNLQREHVERLIDLSMPESWAQSSHKPIANLALMHLRDLGRRLAAVEDRAGLDAYTRAHLGEARLRIEKALEAGYLINAGAMGGGVPIFLLVGQTNAPAFTP